VIVTYRHEQLDGVVPADPAGLVASVDAVLADNRFPDFVRPLCQAARERGLPVVLDADRPTQMSDDLFRIATHVVFSSECLRATTGLDDLAAALARISDLTPSFLAVTQGAQDVLWRDG
jgi:sulfofructose kinase